MSVRSVRVCGGGEGQAVDLVEMKKFRANTRNLDQISGKLQS
jgi:hypothetical protein